MSIRRCLHVAALAAILVTSAAPAGEYTAGGLVIENPWTRATPKGAAVAGGYLTITNKGPIPDRLIGGAVAFAGRFELHEMKTENGVMRMRPLAQGLEIGPGETVELKPGGFHVMFMDLKQAPREGERLKGTLIFEKAGAVEIEYAVGAIGGPPPVEPRGR